MEKVLLRMQSVIGDTKKQISEHYRQVVQLEEQLSDNIWQLHFCQGVVESMGQVRSFMGEGDLPQSLMRLQNARVDVYCELSKNFEVKVTLNKALSKLKDELGMVKGMATVDKNEATVLRRRELHEVIDNLSILIKENDDVLHKRRGMIAGYDEAEKTINDELNPVESKAKVATSPGVVGPDFEGQAMDKPKEGVKFPSEVEPSIPSEYYPREFQQRASIDEGSVQ